MYNHPYRSMFEADRRVFTTQSAVTSQSYYEYHGPAAAQAYFLAFPALPAAVVP